MKKLESVAVSCKLLASHRFRLNSNLFLIFLFDNDNDKWWPGEVWERNRILAHIVGDGATVCRSDQSDFSLSFTAVRVQKDQQIQTKKIMATGSR